jgi:nitroreductase
MVRSYDPNRPVPVDVLNMCLNRAIRAPSAGHTPGRRFLVLDDITSRDYFWSVTSEGPADAWRAGMQHAPVLVVLFADPPAYRERYSQPDKSHSPLAARDDWPIPYWHVDTGMAAMLLMLVAHNAGLGSCFFGVPPDRWNALAERFAVPVGLEPVGVVSLGYPAEGVRSTPSRRRNAPFEDAISYRSFADPA